MATRKPLSPKKPSTPIDPAIVWPLLNAKNGSLPKPPSSHVCEYITSAASSSRSASKQLA